jgi:hypothetical protein
MNGTYYTIDGVWNMNTGNMTQTTIIPNPDTIEEVRVIQNNYSPKYSIMGASVVMLQTRSGTRDYHRSAVRPYSLYHVYRWLFFPRHLQQRP